MVLVMGIGRWTAPEVMWSVGNSDLLLQIHLSHNVEREMSIKLKNLLINGLGIRGLEERVADKECVPTYPP